MNVTLNLSAEWEKHTRGNSTASTEPQTVKGWKVSARQCELITLGDRAAVDKFFEENLQRLTACARKYLRRGYIFKQRSVELLELDNLINQVYVDMRRGFLVVNMQHISEALFHSFRFAGVGGFGDDLGAYEYKPRKRAAAVL